MTSSEDHTPGPWHTSSTHSGAAYDIGAANGANIALVSGPKENGADEFKANARLIAAAPELLAALDNFCHQVWAGDYHVNRNREGIRAAYDRAASAVAAAAKGGPS